MKRFIALMILAATSLPAQADWRFEDGVAIATPDQRNTSNIDAVVISCADPYLFEVYADGGPVRPSSGGTETDYFYQPGKVRADVDGTFFPFVAAGSGEAVVLFAEGSAANDYLGTNDPAFIAALKHGREMRIAFDIVEGGVSADGSPFETYAWFSLSGAAAVLDQALAGCM